MSTDQCIARLVAGQVPGFPQVLHVADRDEKLLEVDLEIALRWAGLLRSDMATMVMWVIIMFLIRST